MITSCLVTHKYSCLSDSTLLSKNKKIRTIHFCIICNNLIKKKVNFCQYLNSEHYSNSLQGRSCHIFHVKTANKTAAFGKCSDIKIFIKCTARYGVTLGHSVCMCCKIHKTSQWSTHSLIQCFHIICSLCKSAGLQRLGEFTAVSLTLDDDVAGTLPVPLTLSGQV